MTTEEKAARGGPTSIQPAPGPLDELTPIANYMAREINANAHGPAVRQIRALHAARTTQCVEQINQKLTPLGRLLTPVGERCARYESNNRAEALRLWALKVMNDAEWDHKPKIRAWFKSATTGTGVYHAFGGHKYYYDIWSNIHYGYVGRAAGFSESMLLDGAGLEQLVTDVVRDQRTYASPNVTGWRRFDNASDRASIAIGVELYRANARGVTGADLMREVLANPHLSKEPLTARVASGRK